jgi:alpha-D-ribose 1-methylphosphonate 5-triphosphate synthase subunit PhnH
MRDPGRGFANPVFDAQAVFRKLQDAMARPGIVHLIDRTATADGLPAAAAAILLTLADYTTPVWLAGGNDHPAAHWLAFHTGARTTTVPAEAQFAFVPSDAARPALSDFAIGEECYPDRSTTVILKCRDFTSGARMRLSGPGILGSIDIAPSGLPGEFWREVKANAARFPMGVDLFLVAGNAAIGLPRSTRVTEAV